MLNVHINTLFVIHLEIWRQLNHSDFSHVHKPIHYKENVDWLLDWLMPATPAHSWADVCPTYWPSWLACLTFHFSSSPHHHHQHHHQQSYPNLWQACTPRPSKWPLRSPGVTVQSARAGRVMGGTWASPGGRGGVVSGSAHCIAKANSSYCLLFK